MADNLSTKVSGKLSNKTRKKGVDNFDDEFGDSADTEKSSDFAQMFEDSLRGVEKKLTVGDRIKGEILSIGKEEVFVSTGTVDDGIVLKSELIDKEGKFSLSVGDQIDLFVTGVKGGQTFLSPKPTAKNMAEDLEDAFDMMLPIEGRVTEVCNGGFRVNVMGKTAFCPISQIDLRRVENGESYIGKKFDFVVTQYSERGRNIVVSRRKLLEEQKELSQASFSEDHKPGDVVQGVVTRIEKFGAFVELTAGLEGLAHVSELSWSRVTDPNEVVKVGQDLTVKILRIEEGANGRMNISLSVKQASAQPWDDMPADIESGRIIEGRVTRCMKFGAFVELAPGIEGLIPLSEMSYSKRVTSSDELVKEGERIRVMIKEIRPDERRIALSLRDAEGAGDPWVMAPIKFPEGTIARGRVERRELYGLFVNLDDGIVGLLPKSKAQENPEFNFDKVKIGDDIVVQVAELKASDRRISLSVPRDPNADAWRGFKETVGSGQKSMGTLGDQFKSMFEGGKKK